MIEAGPLREAVRKLGERSPVASALSSAEWAEVPLALRERAMWSARVESLRFLGEMQARLGARLAQERERTLGGRAFVDRSSFIADMRRIAQEEGIETQDGSYRGTVRDIRSAKRLGLIWDQQTEQAQEYARWKAHQDGDVLAAFPAQRFTRVESRDDPRGDWPERWKAAGSAVGWEGAKPSPMVALKTSPIWERLSRFGTPWPPFDYGSGMGTVDVDREQAERLGLIEPEAPVEPVEKAFNERVEASAKEIRGELREKLELAFGDAVEIDGETARWAPPRERYRSALDLGLVRALRRRPETAPPTVDARESARRLREGVRALDPQGREVRFGPETIEHWMQTGAEEAETRQRHLSWAVATVRRPWEIWEQEHQSLYVQTFERGAGPYRAVVVARRHDGAIARTYFLKDAGALDRLRQGVSWRPGDAP